LPGALLDTNALYWLVTAADTLSEEALIAIAENQAAGKLYVSPITAWELALAVRKPQNPVNLGESAASKWFSDAVKATASKVIPIQQRIACEASAVIDATGHRDPGDCYVMATARVKRVPIITRDGVMYDIAGEMPEYLTVILC
jgi:PIN domain nuclease of toxin-antitoxin system